MNHAMKYILILFFLHISIAIQASQKNDEAQIVNIINQIKFGWENGDGAPFLAYFLDHDGARYFESGGQNDSLKDLIEHHVEPEKDALVFLSLNYSNIQIHVEGDFAWVLADTAVEGEVKKSGRRFDKTGYQTFIFKKIKEQWKVIHTHSSSRDRR